MIILQVIMLLILLLMLYVILKSAYIILKRIENMEGTLLMLHRDFNNLKNTILDARYKED